MDRIFLSEDDTGRAEPRLSRFSQLPELLEVLKVLEASGMIVTGFISFSITNEKKKVFYFLGKGKMKTETMINDPAPPPATCVFSEVKDDKDTQLPSAAKKPAFEFFEKNKITKVPVIALQSDLHTIENQKWACFSIIKPDEYGKLSYKEKTYNGYLIKFRGCFATKEQAIKHIEKIMSVDKHFDVHLVPMFQWASMEDNDPEDREYVNDVIKDIVTGYFKKENEKFAHFRDRIANTESCERSEEATQFFKMANQMKDTENDRLERALDEDANTQESSSVVISTLGIEESARSLDEIAKEFEVKPAGSWCDHGEIDGSCVQSIVSEILLD